MKDSNEHQALRSLARRLEADFGAVCCLEVNCPMLDVRLGGELFVVDYDNGPTWQPPKLFRVAQVTGEYAFNMSNDPSFATLDLAEQHLRTKLFAHLPPNRNTTAE